MVMSDADEGVGEREPGEYAEGAEDDGQRGEAVGAGVQAVGDERRGADASSDADAVERDELVAGEPDQSCGDEDADVGDGFGVEEAADRLVSGDDGRQRDHGDDEDSGQVFGSSVAVGVAPRCRSTAEGEGDPQRERGQRVGEVVDGVGEQRDRSGQHDDDGLQHAGDEQGDQADLDCAYALGAGFQRGVDRVRGVVAVRAENRQKGTADAPSCPCPCPCPCPWPCSCEACPVAVAVVGVGGRFRVLVRGHLVRVRIVTTLCNHARAR